MFHWKKDNVHFLIINYEVIEIVVIIYNSANGFIIARNRKILGIFYENVINSIYYL